MQTKAMSFYSSIDLLPAGPPKQFPSLQTHLIKFSLLLFYRCMIADEVSTHNAGSGNLFSPQK